MIEKKNEVNSWVHHVEHSIHGIFKLQNHIGVRPVTLSIFTLFKEDKERALISSKWRFVCCSKNLNGRFSVSILFALSLKIDFFKDLFTNPSNQTVFPTDEC
jgi:hypothetical protein